MNQRLDVECSTAISNTTGRSDVCRVSGQLRNKWNHMEEVWYKCKSKESGL